MIKTLTFLLCCLCTLSLTAQNGLPFNAGGRGAALGNASSTFSDVNSIWSNQAGLAWLDQWAVGLYAEQRFLLAGVNGLSFGAALPFRGIGAFGLSVQHFGFSDYNEQKIGLSYARKLFPHTSIGIQFDYLSTRIPDYGQAHNFTAELGILSEISKEWRIAAHVYNPFAVALPNGDRLPTQFKVGLGYQPNKKVSLLGELEKDLQFPLRGKLGLEYRLVDAFALRLGFSSKPSLSTFGFGLYLKQFCLDFAASYHPVLGFTPSIGLVYQHQKGQAPKPDNDNE